MRKYWPLLTATAVITVLLFSFPLLADVFVKDTEYIYPTVTDVKDYAVCSGIIAEKDGKLYVKANISESDIPYVKIGQTVEITGNALGSNVYYGTVLDISEKATTIQSGTSTRTVIKCDIKFDDNTDTLKSGYNVTAKIITKVHNNAVIVPFDSVLNEGKNKYVYVIHDSFAKKQIIETSGETTDGYMVSVGVDDSSKVIYDPTGLNGADIRVNAYYFGEEY